MANNATDFNLRFPLRSRDRKFCVTILVLPTTSFLIMNIQNKKVVHGRFRCMQPRLMKSKLLESWQLPFGALKITS